MPCSRWQAQQLQALLQLTQQQQPRVLEGMVVMREPLLHRLLQRSRQLGWMLEQVPAGPTPR